jgi:hypothetical protein
VKEAGEYAGAHVLSMVLAQYPLVDLACLEKGYLNEIGPKEADDLRIGLLDLSSTVIGDINLCGPSAPPSQSSLDELDEMWPKASSVGDGWSTPVVSTSQAPVAQTSSTVPVAHTATTGEQRPLASL